MDHGDDQPAGVSQAKPMWTVACWYSRPSMSSALRSGTSSSGPDRAEDHEVVDVESAVAGEAFISLAQRQKPAGVGRGIQRVLRGRRQRLARRLAILSPTRTRSRSPVAPAPGRARRRS